MKNKINIFLVIIWMLIIFLFSSFNATESSDQSGVIVKFIANLFNINNIELLSLIIRKLAHFTEYLILGLLVINMMKDYHYSYLIISIIICIIYAISDEMHQLFVPGRSCQLTDILIDSLGSIMGIYLYKRLFIKDAIIKGSLSNNSSTPK